jgi:hypothetical protein
MNNSSLNFHGFEQDGMPYFSKFDKTSTMCSGGISGATPEQVRNYRIDNNACNFEKMKGALAGGIAGGVGAAKILTKIAIETKSLLPIEAIPVAVGFGLIGGSFVGWNYESETGSNCVQAAKSKAELESENKQKQKEEMNKKQEGEVKKKQDREEKVREEKREKLTYEIDRSLRKKADATPISFEPKFSNEHLVCEMEKIDHLEAPVRRKNETSRMLDFDFTEAPGITPICFEPTFNMEKTDHLEAPVRRKNETSRMLDFDFTEAPDMRDNFHENLNYYGKDFSLYQNNGPSNYFENGMDNILDKRNSNQYGKDFSLCQNNGSSNLTFKMGW